MGIGFILVVAPDKVNELLLHFRMEGESPLVIGTVVSQDVESEEL